MDTETQAGRLQGVDGKGTESVVNKQNTKIKSGPPEGLKGKLKTEDPKS